ncbi:Fic family protein [Bifidobacterium polysaccharolyticum]|uniref:Fic family protein n=1 Tax=Bifidobacterium polysaccharolyticum TaxID=2750967 RepID=UPI0021BAFA85|nr:Fic family protein [Bifidobacterium polysaccharolyticum]MCT8158391.1 Fic family protein [Bifidobacterium polysaccharolyticum]
MCEYGSLSTKQLAVLLYSMGRTFDGLQSTFMVTEEFLRTGNPQVVNSKADYNLLLDLRQAADYTLHDYAREPIDLAYVKSINAQLTRTAAMEPGKLRDERTPVMVSTPLGRYEPPVPDSATIASLIKSTVGGATGEDILEDAVRLFAGLAKMQPFGDGNKRTALLAGNGLLIAHGDRHPLTVPTSDKDRTWFNRELAAYYLNSDQTIIRHLAKWNRQHVLQAEHWDNRDDLPSSDGRP